MMVGKLPVMSHQCRPNFEVELNKVPIVAEFLAYKVNSKCSPMTLNDLIARHSNKDVYVAIDPVPIALDRFGVEYLLVNSVERFNRLKKIWVNCIDTDYLYPKGDIR